MNGSPAPHETALNLAYLSRDPRAAAKKSKNDHVGGLPRGPNGRAWRGRVPAPCEPHRWAAAGLLAPPPPQLHVPVAAPRRRRFTAVNISTYLPWGGVSVWSRLEYSSPHARARFLCSTVSRLSTLLALTGCVACRRGQRYGPLPPLRRPLPCDCCSVSPVALVPTLGVVLHSPVSFSCPWICSARGWEPARTRRIRLPPPTAVV